MPRHFGTKLFLKGAFTLGWSVAHEAEDGFKSFVYTKDLLELGFAGHKHYAVGDFALLTVVS